MAQLNSILAVIGIIISFSKITSAVLDTTEVGRSCGPQLDVDRNSDDLEADIVIDEMKKNLTAETSRESNYKCYRRIRLEDENFRSCYGLGLCNTALSAEECEMCLTCADVRVTQGCGFVSRATIVLQDCYMRFSMKYFYEGFRPKEVEEAASLPDGIEESTKEDQVP